MTLRPWQRWVLWGLALAALTAAMFAFRGRLDKAHVTLLYLLVVLLGTVSGGRMLGFSLAGAAFVLFNWFFLLPYGTLRISDPLDWLVLAAFILVSGIAAEILHRLQREAESARQRVQEIDQFAALGAESLNAARPDVALAAVAEVIRNTLGLTACRIHAWPGGGAAGDEPDPLASWVGEHGGAALRLADGTTRLSESAGAGDAPSAVGAVALYLPLSVRQRPVGVLELVRENGLELDPAERRFLHALSFYAALGIERGRLTAEADHVVALREADRLKDALLASVSHDLRTPLTTIKALAHELGASDDRARVIEEEADRLNRLVADLLDLSRLQGGAIPLSVTFNAVDDLIGAVAQRVAGLLGQRRLDIVLDEGDAFLIGRFDLVHAIRILVNLVENAHKYSPSAAPITLRVHREAGWLRLTVADRGSGVAPAERERIFEPFYRPANAIADSGSAGLGLSISRRLAELMDGTLTYAPGVEGSAFTLSLPAADVPPDTIEAI